MSKTALASGWSPKRGWSPVSSRMLGMPRAAAEIRSDCRAIRLRSRQVSCITGSTPADFASRLPAKLDSRTWALWLSVTLAASTQPLNRSAFLAIAAGSAPRGGPISAVTTNRPEARARRSRPLAGTRPLPAGPAVTTAGPDRRGGRSVAGAGRRWRSTSPRRGPASSSPRSCAPTAGDRSGAAAS